MVGYDMNGYDNICFIYKKGCIVYEWWLKIVLLLLKMCIVKWKEFYFC